MMRKIAYCKTEMKKLDEGGQSSIYECDGDLIKIYKNSWKANMQQMHIILKGLDEGIVILKKD